MANKLQEEIESLKDKTDGEKHKIVNQIINNYIKNLYEENSIETFLKSDATKDDTFVKHLYIGLIIHRKDPDPVLRILLSENEFLITEAIKKFNFFWSNKKYTPDFYISTIFPYVSYIHRLKILKAISNNLNDEHRSELFYNQLRNAYSSSTAQPFLKHCSATFIFEKLNYCIILSEEELDKIMKNKSKFVLEYLNKISDMHKAEIKFFQNVDSNSYARILKKLIMLYPLETFEMIERNKQFWTLNSKDVNLGRKVTKKMLQNVGNILIENSKHYYSILKENIVVRKLSKQQLESFYCNLFEKNNDMYFNFVLLQHLKTNEEIYTFYTNCYKRFSGKELASERKNITIDIVKIMDVECRHKFATEKIEKGGDENLKPDEWIPYLKSEISIPKLKEKIQISSDPTKRKSYIKFLIDTCNINQDYESLLKVLKYINERHRNEQSNVRYELIDNINENFKLKRFNESHWEELLKTIDLIFVKNEQEHWRFYSSCSNIFPSAIEFCLKKDLSVEKWMIYRMKIARYSYDNAYFVIKNKPKYQKICINLIGNLLQQVFKDDVNHYQKPHINFLTTVSEWNKKFPNDTISIIDFPYMIECIKKDFEMTEKYEVCNKRTIRALMKNDEKAVEYFKEELKKVQLESLEYKINDEKTIDELKDWLINEQEFIKSKIDQICEIVIEKPYEIRSFLLPLLKKEKLKIIPELEEKLHQHCMKILKDKNTNEHKAEALRIAVYNMAVDEFYDITRSYFPEDKKIDTEEEDAKTKFEFQKQIAYSLKHYRNHSETLDAIKRFCVGDFLQYTLHSLTDVCIKLPCYKSKEFLQSCLNTPVSMKKTIIRLHSLIFEKSLVTELLKKLWNTEKHLSIREVVLQSIFKYFVNEPENILWWNLIREYIQMLTDKDISILDTIINFDKIPEKYYSEYCQLCWLIILKIEQAHPEIKDKKDIVLSAIESSISTIEPTFIENLLSENLFCVKLDLNLQNKFSSLAARYILQDVENKLLQKQRIDYIISLIKLAFDHNWNTSDIDDDTIYPVRQSIENVLSSICNYAVDNDYKKKYANTSEFVLTEMRDKLNDVCDPKIYLYTEYTKFELAAIYKQNENITEFGKNIRPLLEREIKVFESFILSLFAETIKAFLTICPDANLNDIADGLLDEPLQSTECALCALLLTNINELRKQDNQKLYKRFLNINDKRVKLYLK